MIIALIIIYLVSVIGAYKYIQFSYFNPKGEWYGLKPISDDFFCVITPLLNTLFTFFYLKNILLGNIDWNKFFNRW